jgi:hypothetical protein
MYSLYIYTGFVSEPERSMPRDAREAYEEAFRFAVLQRDASFLLADQFALWFCKIGRQHHEDDLSAAWERWLRENDHIP